LRPAFGFPGHLDWGPIYVLKALQTTGYHFF